MTTQGEQLTTAFTIAVRSAQIVPPVVVVFIIIFIMKFLIQTTLKYE